MKWTLVSIAVVTCALTLFDVHITSVSPCGFLLYQFSHVSLLHWLSNAICALFLFRAITTVRFIRAYLLSIIAAFLPAAFPVEGFSVILFYIIGCVALTSRRNLLICGVYLTAGFFFANIAALHHLFMFLFGFLPSLIKDYRLWKAWK